MVCVRVCVGFCSSVKGPSLQLRTKRSVGTPTNHAVNGAKEHRALGGGGTLAQVLQHQWAMAEDINKLAQVEDSHLLQVLPLLVSGGRAYGEKKRDRFEITDGVWKTDMTVGGGAVCVCVFVLAQVGPDKSRAIEWTNTEAKNKTKEDVKSRTSRKRFQAERINEVKEKQGTQRRAGVSGKVRRRWRANGIEVGCGWVGLNGGAGREQEEHRAIKIKVNSAELSQLMN